MDDLINSVKQRYRQSFTYRNFASISYRAAPAPEDDFTETEKKKTGLLDLFRPQISGISQKLHTQISNLFHQRDKEILQTIHLSMPRLVQQHVVQWKSESLTAEKKRIDLQKNTNKRVELFVTDTGVKMNNIQRELERLKAHEKHRQREEARIMQEEPPMTHKTAKRLVEEYRTREREELINEIDISAVKTERRVVRRLRDDVEYEKRRRG